MNQVVLIGRLTKDFELRFIPSSGTAVGRAGLAVNREYKKEGQPEADFFNIVAWGKQAENAANYTKKGRLIAVIGNLRNNNYEDKNGVKHYNIEVVAQRIEFLEWGNKPADESYPHNQQNNQQEEQPNKQSYQNDLTGFQAIDGDDDIPF